MSKAKEYTKHTEQDAALKQEDDDVSSAMTTPGQGLTLIGKIAVFLGFPMTVGFIGLYISFLETVKDPTQELSIDQDFIMPFLLALAMVTVIGLQTNGYSQKKIKPLVPWPKVKRVKRIVRKKKSEMEETTENKKDK